MKISLNGDGWLIKDFVGEDWLWRDAHKPGTRDVRFWRRGRVPGSIHDDLWRNGEIANPYVDRNTLLCEWVSQRTWIYKKSFEVDPEWTGSRAVLRFDGVDYAARFYLNGELIGRHESQFVPARFEVTGRLRHDGPNLVAVVLDPAPPEQPQVGYTHLVRTRKTRMNYWWDFCPRLVHLGLWRDACLELTGPVRIEDVWPHAELLDGAARVAVTIRLSSTAESREPVDVVLREADTGQIAAQAHLGPEIAAGITEIRTVFDLTERKLWWPDGMGEQTLYRAEVSVGHSDSLSVTFGVRSIELVQNEGADPRSRPYTFSVNGQPVYANGWNWVPLDVLYGVPRPDKLMRLLDLAQDAGVNLLRVWGGGLIESQAFYDECDRRGIMVWQEFIQSSSGIDNNPPDDPAVVAKVVTEAEGIVPLLRNHPSLALWCGGNELQRGPEQPCDGSEPVLASLQGVVERLDPGRAWLPTSPSGGVFGNSLENIEKEPARLHDVHGPWQHEGLEKQFELSNRTTARLNSEFGAAGAANLKTIEAVLPEEHRWPATRDNPSWFHTASWWIKETFFEEVLGAYPPDLPSFVRVTQYLQASALQYALEANRRRWPQCSGSLPWQFNEPFPNAFGTPAVDYFGEPKPAYYAVKRAYAPVQVTARFARQSWGGKDTFEAEVFTLGAENGWTVSAEVVGLDGEKWGVQPETLDSAPGDHQGAKVTTSLDRKDGLFFLTPNLRDAEGAARATNRYLFTRDTNLAALLGLPQTQLTAAAERHGDQWRVTVRNDGKWAALGVWLEDARPRNWSNTAWTTFNDNYVHVLPGEEMNFSCEWGLVRSGNQALTVSAMNAPQILVS